jgi:hypothetical protein
MNVSTKMQPRKLKRRRHPRGDAIVPADPVVTKLFLDLQMARDVQRRKLMPGKTGYVRRFERKAWYHLMEYFLTLESEVY